MRAARSAVAFEVRMGPSHALESSLARGDLDVAALLSSGDVRERAADLVWDPVELALPVAHPGSSRSRLGLKDLADEPFVLPRREVAPELHDAVLRACRGAGFVPRVRAEVDDLPLLLALVAAGVGIALVPAHARSAKQAGILIRELEPRGPSLGSGLIWNPADPLAVDLAEMARSSPSRQQVRGAARDPPSRADGQP
jgi:DNA-binding transcriptional LysR family regulator